ncbi:urease accessory protein UreF [Spirulina sp. CS-785/01]|uniref:urease accessory protein UreF n=1 Tax=Spirulina sp. CS-785/01 TaxID=3021716 RepID=UPI00232B0EEC|nr:urease accessory protein UreF [Spirulina sp. CS-785/01]MDB9312539.1 urease accessory protein UreF [Spirulina sp. CS-785/01]
MDNPTIPTNSASLNPETLSLLRLLQLASPALPVGAYSYSEGLESLVEQKKLDNLHSLCSWLEQELRYGAIRLETAILLRAYHSTKAADGAALSRWNAWLSATRETQELREQSWQMGGALLRLLVGLDSQFTPLTEAVGSPCNFAILFGLAAATWDISPKETIAAYLHSWASNLINGGVKLIPLGQTAGQQGLTQLYPIILQVTEEILQLEDEDLASCGWGLALASISHETQYSRLFRS